jgi:hypothetical protein
VQKLTTHRLGLGPISCLLQALTRLEQVLRQIGVANVHTQPLDHTGAFDDRAARLPERAPLARTDLDYARREPQRAPLWLDLAHGFSVQSARHAHIRAAPEFECGLLLKRDHGQRDRAQGHHAGQGNHNGRLAAVRGVLTHE